MEAHSSLPHLREVLLFLVLAGVLIPLLQRLRINQVLGFLAAGAVLGPFGLGRLAADAPWIGNLTIPRIEGVNALAELGIIFLLFRIGLELSLERLWSLRRWVFGVGTAQVLLSAAVIVTIALLYGNPAKAAIVLGLVLALSSTAMVVQLLTARRALATPVGRASFAVLLLQDLAVVPLLVLVGVLGGSADGSVASLLGLASLKAVAAIAVIYLLGRRVIRPLFRTFVAVRQPEVFMALTLLATLGIGALTWAAGLSMALGAFLAGMLLAETEFRHEVEVTIEPFRGLLMGIFFISIGMSVDLVDAAQRWPLLVPAAACGLIVLKAIIAIPLLRLGGLGWPAAIHAGLLLGQGGEFAFIIIGVAVTGSLLSAETAEFMLVMVWLTMLLTPLLDRVGRMLASRLLARSRENDAIEAAVPELRDHVVIAGFGRVGQLLAQVLDAQQVAWVALDSDAKVAAQFHPGGQPVYYGDASRPDMLRKLHIDGALAVVLTMDDPAAALAAAVAVHEAASEVPILARARDERHAALLRDAGATLVIPETLEAGLQLAHHVLQRIGFPIAASLALIDEERERRMG